MPESTTIARPYAKAVFEHALAKGKLALWSEVLNNLALASLQPQVVNLLASPLIAPEEKAEVLLSVIDSKKTGDEYQSISNLVNLLIENKRLPLVADIRTIYEFFRSEQEKTLMVEVESFSELSAEQEQKLAESLSKKLKRTIQIKNITNPDLLGGACIRAADLDLVIDGSVRGQLSKLAHTLTA